MNIDSEIISPLVGQIYEAAYDPAIWPGVVERVCGMVHGSKACLVRIGPDLQPSDAVAANADPAFQERYTKDFAHESNVFADAVGAAPVGLVYNDHALIGHERLRATRFWNEWMAPQDMYGGLACKLLASDPSYWIFDVQRGRRQEQFDTDNVKLFKFLAPHIRRSIEIGRALQTQQAVSLAFSHLPFGIVLVDGFQRIVSMNEAAEAIFARPGRAIQNVSGHLVTTDAASTATLRQLVADACILRDGTVPGLGGDFLIRTKRRDSTPMTLSISVGPFSARGSFLMERCAVVVIRDMTFDLPTGFAEHIRNLFDLTPRESGLAASLAAGLSLKEAARNANIQFSTARSHLENIFHKTGTNQQSQLVALLKGAQPLRRG